tara:strand:+ start:375 stop:1145 length:771 start_codon:yes stop_codon:yes gene_type:complete
MPLKIAIYTAIFGEKDVVREPLKYIKNENIDYFLISDDRGIESKCYKIIYKKPIYDDITKNARYYKIIGLELFKNYDFVIWHDGNIQINDEEIPNFVHFALKSNYAFYKHPTRNCIYDEAIKCIELEKDFPFILLKQVLKYFRSGITNNIGLYATGLYVKNNQFNNVDFMEQWWTETKHYSRRDQISLPYCLKKNQIKPIIINGNIRDNKYSIFHSHKHSKYNFLTLGKSKPINKWFKAIAIKIILFLKKINFNGI